MKTIYAKQKLAEYKNNPLIEALPSIRDRETAIDLMTVEPIYNAEERQFPTEERLHCVQRLLDLVQPLPNYISFERAISRILRKGYVSRNPMVPMTWQYLHYLAKRGEDGVPMPVGFKPTSSALTLTGLSGIGKSTMIQSVLDTYPQLISHKKYKDKPFCHTQVVWIKIDCPHNGTIKGLCFSFFRELDRLLGTDYLDQYGHTRISEEKLVKQMELLASTHFVGLLVIDEIQILSVVKSGGADKMMNFFVNLINTINIPLVLIGTYASTSLFSGSMRDARRASGQGYFDFQRPSRNSATWRLLVESVWEYQWVKTPAPLTEEIVDTLYDLTQGVTAFLVMLHIFSQWAAMEESEGSNKKKEYVKEDILKRVASSQMVLLEKAINALRSNKPKDLEVFDDLLPPKEALNSLMTKVLNDHIEKGYERLLGNKMDKENISSSADSKDTEDLVELLGTSTVDSPLANIEVRATLADQNYLDLRSFKNGESIYDDLKEKGLIVDDVLEFNQYS